MEVLKHLENANAFSSCVSESTEAHSVCCGLAGQMRPSRIFIALGDSPHAAREAKHPGAEINRPINKGCPSRIFSVPRLLLRQLFGSLAKKELLLKDARSLSLYFRCKGKGKGKFPEKPPWLYSQHMIINHARYYASVSCDSDF